MIDSADNTLETPAGDSSGLGQPEGRLSPAELLRQWRLYRERCARRVQKDCCVLSPMDEAFWFELPVCNLFLLSPGTDQLVVKANPQRVGLIFSVGSLGIGFNFSETQTAASVTTGTIDQTTGVVNTSTNNYSSSNVGTILPSGCFLFPRVGGSVIGVLSNTTAGLYISTITGPLSILQADFGPLCSMAWQGGSDGLGNTNLAVIEVVLRDFPQQE